MICASPVADDPRVTGEAACVFPVEHVQIADRALPVAVEAFRYGVCVVAHKFTGGELPVAAAVP